MAPHRKTVIFAVCCSVVSLLSLGGIASSLHDVRRARQAEAWPAVDGVVVESRFARGCGRGGGGYYSRVRYEYRAEGTARTGWRIMVGSGGGYVGESAARDIAGRYPVGAVVRVSFDPDAPDEAVLVTGQVPESTWPGIVFLTFLFLLSAALASLFVAMARSSLRARQSDAKRAPPNSP